MGNDVNTFWEIMKIVLPALVVFLTAYFLFRDMLENAQKQREFEFRVSNMGKITPVRLQAYERFTLLLERISPHSLLLRVNPHDMKAGKYHQELLNDIRQEFEHNLSQQIYISPILWETIRGTREKLIGIINKSSEEIEDKAPALSLSKKIFDNYLNEDNDAIAIALNELKKEVSKMF